MTKKVLLGEIAEIKMGQSPPSSTYNTKMVGLPFMQGVRTFGDKHPKIDTWCNEPNKIADKSDVLISVRAPVGEINITPERMCIGRGLAAISGRNNEFIYYLLKANAKKLKDRETGSVFGSIDRNGLASLELQIPESERTQDKIAKILGDLDAKIELNRKMNETLEKIGQALFKHYFIDNPDRKNWETVPISELVNIKYGKNLPTSKLAPTGYPVFGGNGIIGFYDEYLFKEQQVLVSCRGEASGKVNISLPHSFITNNSLILEIKSSDINFEWLKYYSLSRMDGYREFVSGSAQPQITVDSLSKCKFLLPDKLLLQRFSTIMAPIQEQIISIKGQNENLAILRDSLLPRLISGE